MSKFINPILKILLIIVLVLFNGVFSCFFLYIVDKQDIAYSNGGCIYGIIGFILLSLISFLNRSKKLELLRNFQAKQIIRLDSIKIKMVFIKAFLRKYMLISIFCIWIITLFVIVNLMNNKMIMSLLYIGLVTLFVISLLAWFNLKYIIIKHKEV